MITFSVFNDEITKLVVLNNLIIKKDFIEYSFEKLKYCEENHFLKAIDEIINQEPDQYNKKFSFGLLKNTINKIRKEDAVSKGMSNETHWDGTPCSHCNDGLLHVERIMNGGFKYLYCFRCSFCSSYHANIPFLSRKEIVMLENGQELENWNEPPMKHNRDSL